MIRNFRKPLIVASPKTLLRFSVSSVLDDCPALYEHAIFGLFIYLFSLVTQWMPADCVILFVTLGGSVELGGNGTWNFVQACNW